MNAEEKAREEAAEEKTFWATLSFVILVYGYFFLGSITVVPVPNFIYGFCRDECHNKDIHIMHLYPKLFMTTDWRKTGYECFCTWGNK